MKKSHLNLKHIPTPDQIEHDKKVKKEYRRKFKILLIAGIAQTLNPIIWFLVVVLPAFFLPQTAFKLPIQLTGVAILAVGASWTCTEITDIAKAYLYGHKLYKIK